MKNFSWFWTEKQHQKWVSHRARGMVHFVIFSGVLAWGVPMFLIMAVGPALFAWPFPAHPSALYWLWQPLLWLAAGLFFGFAVWYTSEHFYRRHVDCAP